MKMILFLGGVWKNVHRGLFLVPNSALEEETGNSFLYRKYLNEMSF